MRPLRPGAVLALLLVSGASAEPPVLEDRVRGHLEMLASDALRGRGSATHDELVAATYVASQLRQYGVPPAGEGGGYFQVVELVRPTFTTPPTLQVEGGPGAYSHGKDLLVLRMTAGRLAGPLRKSPPESAVPGAVVLLTPDRSPGARPLQAQAFSLLGAGAAAVLIPETPELRALWADRGAASPRIAPRLASAAAAAPSALAVLSTSLAATLQAVPEGTPVVVEGALAPDEKGLTWNVVGRLPGSGNGPAAVLLSAHLDHLGLNPELPGDTVFNGADDDASGVAAVLEMARALAAGEPIRRSVIFAFFGSEETGGFGSRYFVDHPPVPLTDIVANLQFEMIGRPDPALPPRTLWLTGYDRSDLGPRLAARGARLVADPHPAERFFERSDNYSLALRGVVAHTVSSFGLHGDYHQVTDELSRIDFPHLAEVIVSLLKPVRWLADSDFVPRWEPGKQPRD